MAKTRKNRRSRKSSGKSRRSASRKSRSSGSSGNASKGESWPQAVKRVYNEMKSKNKDYQFKDAMSEASRRKRAGTL